MIKSAFLCMLFCAGYSITGFTQEKETYPNTKIAIDHGLTHSSSNRWNNDYSVEIHVVGVGYHFKHIPSAISRISAYDAYNDPQTYGANGLGIAFSKTLNSKARIDISPALYMSDNQKQYYSTDFLIQVLERTYDLHGFSIPINYISYFKTPKKRVSWYWLGGMEYTSLKLVTHDIPNQNNSLTAPVNTTYKEHKLSLFAGLGMDCKLSKRFYLFYDMKLGVTLADPTTFEDARVGVRVNFFKK